MPLAREELPVRGNSGEVDALKFSLLLQSSVLHLAWLVASEVHCGQFSQARRKKVTQLLVYFIKSTQFHTWKFGKYREDCWYKFRVFAKQTKKWQGSLTDLLSNISFCIMSRYNRH